MLQSPGAAGTAVVNGQLTSQAPGFSFSPVGYVPYSAQGGNFPPSIPPSVSTAQGIGGTAYSSNGQPSTYASADDNSALVANAMANPWSTKSSPVIPALIALAVSLALLHFVHFRKLSD